MGKRLAVVTTAVLSLLLMATLAGAQSQVVELSYNQRYGTILTDGDGYSLYLYTVDEVGEGDSISNCSGICTRNWPPLLVEGELVAGEGVDAALLGTIEREDGTMQATYNGWPLYRSNRDSEPGQILGQRLGNVFFLVSPAGEPVTTEVAQVIDISADAFNALMSLGQDIYVRSCAACHGQQGEGLVGPGFAGNNALSRNDLVIPMILDGFPDHGMPAWRNRLNDEEIAAVATFIRNSWGNDFGPVLEEQVAAER